MTDTQILLQFIAENSVTLAQIKNVSKAQLVTLLGDKPGTYFKNILRPIIRNMQEQQNDVDLQDLKDRLPNLKDKFPNVEFKRYSRGGRRFGLIAFDGFPPEEIGL